MSATTVTPSSATMESPKLVKKAASTEVEKKTPSGPMHTSFGCTHIQNLLKNAREQATENYIRMMKVIKDVNNTSKNIYKLGEGAKATGDVTYLCFQCPTVSKKRQAHRKDHIFSVESNHGFIYCHECTDFIYDPTFEEVRSGNAKKRKHAEVDRDTKRFIANNSTPTPCAATGLRGLYNMGQTCFMSVILQSLIHNPIIRTFYLSEGHRKDDCEREACTSCALDDIFQDFFSQEKHEGYGAVHMLQGCWKGGGSLAGYSQQDAHEFLGFILNSLHSANTAEDDDSQGNITQPKDAAARDCSCVIHQTFGGLLKSTVTCSTCKNITTALDPFMDLSLDIRSSQITKKEKKLKLINGTSTSFEPKSMDLTDCLNRFTSAETLTAEGGNYHCRTCNSAQEAKKRLSLVRLPPVIPIHLKRFRHEKTLSQSSKIETKIHFPLTLDLTPYCSSSSSKSKESSDSTAKSSMPNGHTTTDPFNPKPSDEENDDDWVPPDPIYELSSVVVHKGKIDNGHYVSYSRQGEEWFRFDDSMVVQVDEKEALGCEAYMLFYVIRELEGWRE